MISILLSSLSFGDSTVNKLVSLLFDVFSLDLFFDLSFTDEQQIPRIPASSEGLVLYTYSKKCCKIF